MTELQWDISAMHTFPDSNPTAAPVGFQIPRRRPRIMSSSLQLHRHSVTQFPITKAVASWYRTSNPAVSPVDRAPLMEYLSPSLSKKRMGY
jgi:hypothetical protein